MPVDVSGTHLKAFDRTGKPIVIIDRKIQGLSCDSVLVDNERAAEDAVEFLMENGHRNIGIIVGPQEIFTAQERLKGYYAAHEKRGIPVQESLIYHGDYIIQGGVKGLEELVKKNPQMTAVFVTNYEMTMGAVIGINELGIHMPKELSMIGFDNLQFARACSPKLTIVSQPTEAIGEKVAQMILSRLGVGEETEEKTVTLKLQTEIIMGKSVRNLNKM